MTRIAVTVLWYTVACLLVTMVTSDSETPSTPVRVPRFVTPLSRVDGLTFANSLGYKGPGAPFSSSSFSFNQPSQFNTPVVFPPHSPTAHLTPYSVFVSPSAHPTSPTLHAAQGVSNFLSKSELSGTPTIHRLPAVTALHNVPVLHSGSSLQSGGYNSLNRNPHFSGGSYGPASKECGGYDSCVPLVSCAPCFDQLSPNAKCALYGGEPGVCCPPTPAPTGPAKRLFQPPNFRVKTPDFSVYQLNEAAKHGLWEVAERDQLEATLQSRNIVVSNRRTPEYLHLQFFKTSPRAMRFGRAAITVERSTSFIMYKYQLTPLQAGFGLRRFSVGDTILQDTCPEIPSCGEKEEYYRTIDGSCNNLRNPTFGQAKTGMQRILPPHYEDGIYEPRGGRDNRRLPSPRVVSISNVADVDSPDLSLTLNVMQWGQFIDHDLTHVPIFRFGEAGWAAMKIRGEGNWKGS